MKYLVNIKKIIASACTLFTVIITALYTLGVSVNSTWIPTLGMFYSLLGFSFILAIFNMFLFSDKLVFSLRLLIHFISTTALFYLLFIKLSGYNANGGSPLAIMLVYCFVYAIFLIILSAYKYLISDNKNKKEEYTRQFKN